MPNIKELDREKAELKWLTVRDAHILRQQCQKPFLKKKKQNQL